MPKPGGTSVFVADYPNVQQAASRAGNKHLVFPENQTYITSAVNIPTGCYVEGNGSTLKFGNNTTTSRSNDELLRVVGSNVTIDGLNFDGNSANQRDWTQHRHCVRIQGTFDGITVKNGAFVNIIGDGVYINTGTHGNISVFDNTFTANYDNRNGVSIVSGDTIEVFQNTFTNTTRNGMPGAIDIEPNFTTDHLAQINIHDNVINGGTVPGTGQRVGIYAALQNGGDDVNDINIRNNDISGTRITHGIIILGVDGGPYRDHGILVDGNKIHDKDASFGAGVEIDYWTGVTVTNNTFEDMVNAIYNYQACLLSTGGNTFVNVTNEITDVTPNCS